jgi:hypothetical protein
MSSEISITLLLVNGERSTFSFTCDQTIENVLDYVYKNWPKEWTEEKPTSYQCLKIIYRGRFLNEKDQLSQFNTPFIAHLIIRPLHSSILSNEKSDHMTYWRCCILL